MESIPSLTEALKQLLNSASAGVVVSFILEELGVFQKLKPKAKKLVVFGLCLGLPLLATVLLQYVPAEIWPELEPFWQALAAGFLAWLSSQVTHMIRKKNNAGWCDCDDA